MNQIPNLAELALQYGTITKKQCDHLNRLFHEKEKSGHPQPFEQLLLTLKLATTYQVGLLKLIREYLIIKKRGEAFGRIAIEKGFAAQEDVDRALEHQKKEFKRAKIRKLIGDILVESQVITVKQKNEVLKEQDFVDQQADLIFSEDADLSDARKDDGGQVSLTEYESKFLKIKALDQEFAARLIEKNMVSVREIKIAQKTQEEAFENENRIRILGDIMVDLNYLTQEQKLLVLKEQERLEQDDLSDSKKQSSVLVSADRMEAVVEISEESGPLDLAAIKTALADKNIRYGIYSDAILQCNLDMGNTRFIAARQDFSVELVNQKKAVYHFDTHSIDTEEKKKGATLAEQHLGQEARVKKDLFGQHVQFSHGWEATFRCGAGTRLSKDKTKAFAAKTGFPSLSVEHKLYVHPAISVLEDADLRYGALEAYANLTISGVLTGAYPVTAGHVKAREIRGATITAIGDVESGVGITDAVIVTQGDVKARYLHNCRIETFGNVYIENEIIDSDIYSSGKVDCCNCHTISSTIYAKKGVVLSGAGSGKTNPCVIGAGTEHHILERIRQLDFEIQQIRKQSDELKEKKEEQNNFSKKMFQKMIELKIFHDRAKKKKAALTEDFKKNKNLYPKEKLNNIVKLIHNFEKRKTASLSSLKELNEIKKKYDKEVNQLEEKIKKLEPKIEKDSRDFQTDIVTFFEWARKQERLPQICIKKKAFMGTTLKGAFSSLTIDKDQHDFIAIETQTSTNQYQLTLQQDNT
jgi:SHS2 domain-containing protein